MTENKRIVLNTIATYGRSMFGVLCGIFSARWVLEALGHIDFGLYGLIGSMALFVGFLNIQFSSAIARYYAYTIGKAKASINSAETIEECREWFSIAVLIHFVLPISLIAIGYPLGVKAINYGWVTVPLDRIDACLWLWRFVCVSCFVSMVNVPFQAMYTAKQNIAELTIYSFLQTILRTGFVYYMVCHPGDWLIGYGLGMMFVTVIPAFLICIRACFVFPECRLRLHAFGQMWRVRQLGSYAVWQGVGGAWISCESRGHECSYK